MNTKITLSLFAAAVALLLSAGCDGGGEGSTESSLDTQSVATNGFKPNPDGFSFANYGDIEEQDIDDNDIATLYGAQNVCYNQDAGSCSLTALGTYRKRQEIDGQKEGQCYGFAVAASMLHHGGYSFEGKSKPSDFNADADQTYDLAKSDVANFIAMKFTNQSTPQVQEYLEACMQSDTLTQYRHIQESFASNDPVAVLAFYDITGNGGHAVTPYKVVEEGDRAKIYVYDNNYPGNDQLVFDIDLSNGSWYYGEGKTSQDAEGSDNYRGQGSINPFCGIALSLTQYVAIEDDTTDNMLTIDLSGEAEEVRVGIANAQNEVVGYDFDAQAYVSEIDGAVEIKRLDGMPSIYKIPVPSNVSNLAAITSEAEFNQYFEEIVIAAAGALSSKSAGASTVSLSMQTNALGYKSALMFGDIVIDQNDALATAFHPGGRFMLFEHTASETSMPILQVYFDDFDAQEGAIHTILLGTVPLGVSIGLFIDSVDTISLFAIDASGDNIIPLEAEVDYAVESQYVSKAGTFAAPTRTVTQPVGSGFRLRLRENTRAGHSIERIF